VNTAGSDQDVSEPGSNGRERLTSSMGTPRVSGTRKRVKKIAMNCQAPKKT